MMSCDDRGHMIWLHTIAGGDGLVNTGVFIIAPLGSVHETKVSPTWNKTRSVVINLG